MKQEMKRCLDRAFQRRRNRRRMMALLAAMSVIVGGDVFWQLRSIGTALAPPGDQIAAEDPQLSNELGLKKKLESVSDWELSLPSDFTGTRREYAAAIAESQLGYTATDGYTRYGDWFGSPYGEWNIAFVHFVMHYAGVAGYEIPYASSCASWFRNLQSRDLLLTADSGFPERGDVLLTDLDADGVADRAGIIAETADQSQVTVIEGNLEGAVGQTSYAWDDACICGWVSLAEPDADAETAASAEDAGTFSDGIEYLSFEAVSESGITVSAKAVPDVFPDGTAMTVHDLPKKDAVIAAEQQLAADMQLLDAVAVDITFTDAEGNELEPAGNAGVEVELKLPPEQQLEGSVFSLLHVTDDGAAEEIPDASVNSEGASFTAESFSVYVVTSANQAKGYQEATSITVAPGEIIALYEDVPEGTTGFFKTNSNWNSEYNYPYVQPNIYLPEHNSDDVTPIGDGMERHSATFTAYREGNITITTPSGDSIAVEITAPKIVANTTYGSVVNTNGNQQVNVNTNNIIEFVYCTYEDLNNFDFRPNSADNITAFGNMSKEWNGSCWVYKRFFQANNVGNASVSFSNGNNSDNRGTMQISITDSQHMTVGTALDERDVDKVNEWLDNPSCDFMDNHDQDHDGYIPNYIAHWNARNQFTNDYDANNIAAYLMYDGVPAEFYYPSGSNITYAVSKLDVTHSKTEGSNRDGQKFDGILPASASEASVTQTQTGDGRTHFSISINTTGFYAFTVLQNGKPVRTIYMFGMEPNVAYPYGSYWPTILQHSDMEIADGGKYTFTEIHVDDNGNVETVIYEYNAAVSYVNQCDLYDAEDQRVKQLDSYSTPNPGGWDDVNPIAGQYNGNDVIFTKDLYKNIGSSGGAQYEWTSNPFIVGKGFQFFDGASVKKVVFNVNLELIPSRKKTITSIGGVVTGQTDWVPMYSSPDEAQQHKEIRENVIYEMGQQDIIDALNKCPNHSGLDFTARSNAAVLSFEAKKELSSLSKTLEAGQYSFEIVDLDNLNDNDQPTVIRTATNKQNPENANDYSYVLFDNIRFEHPGVYHYEIREVIPADADENMLYDKQTYPVTVEIREGDNGMLYGVLLGDIPKERVFTNREKYELPATGGIGVWPYMFGGITIISMACFVLLETKKKYNADNFK